MYSIVDANLLLFNRESRKALEVAFGEIAVRTRFEALK